MPTPASGQISMNDMRTHINRATSSSISMSEMRDRYGGSGQISFSDLRNCEGFTANPANYVINSKYYSANIDGWDRRIYGFGSISPDEANGIQIAANSYIGAMGADAGTSSGYMTLYTDTSFDQTNTGYTAGYGAINVTRVVTANVARSITGTYANSQVYYTYDWPTSGTIHCLVKF